MLTPAPRRSSARALPSLFRRATPTPTPTPTRGGADISYGTLVEELKALARAHPTLASAYTAQERFGLSSAGRCTSADGSVDACKVWVIAPCTPRPAEIALAGVNAGTHGRTF